MIERANEELECPKCHEIYPEGRQKCRCGHVFTVASSNKTCAWPDCPLSGTISNGLRGGGKFYCRWHYFAEDPMIAGQITEQIIRGEIGPDKTDWRETMIAAFQKDHPEFAVIPDKGEESDMVRMCKTHMQKSTTPPRKPRGYVPGVIENEEGLIDEAKERYREAG